MKTTRRALLAALPMAILVCALTSAHALALDPMSQQEMVALLETHR